MWRAALAFFLMCSGCGPADQPESDRTVAAFEIPLPTASDREAFLDLLGEEAKADGFHVDSWTAADLEHMSDLVPLTINAAVWRGEKDEESVASVMDHDRPGQAWIMFAKGVEPERWAQFRDRVMRRVRQRWPETRSLPVTPSGGIPLGYHLRRTDEGYRIRPEAASNYQVSPDSPLVARE